MLVSSTVNIILLAFLVSQSTDVEPFVRFDFVVQPELDLIGPPPSAPFNFGKVHHAAQ